MLKFETKHERNAIKITTLVVLIVALLLFVVGPNYMDPPEEYGVAINFGDGNILPNNSINDTPFSQETIEEESDEIEDIIEDIENVEEDITEDEPIEEEPVEDEPTEEDNTEEEQAEQELLEQQQAEAERLKAEAEAKKRAEEAKKKAAKDKADREAKEKAARQAKAKAAAEKRAKAAKAAAAKAEADRKAAAAKAAQSNNKGSGGSSNGFNLSQEGPIYPGCEGLDNNARAKCMRNKIAQFVTKNYNKKIATDLGLTGDQSIKIRFSVDINGKIIGVRAIASHPDLINETKRVMSLLPKIKPALQQGKPKKVSFSVPIKIEMN